MTELFLIAIVAGKRLAFRTAEIQSVIDLGTVSPAPGTPDFVTGLAALRSRPMTVIDCAVSLSIVRSSAAPTRGLVVERDGYLYALAIDEVEDAIWIDDDIEPVPAALPESWQHVALGMVRVKEEMLLLADTCALLDGPVKRAA